MCLDIIMHSCMYIYYVYVDIYIYIDIHIYHRGQFPYDPLLFKQCCIGQVLTLYSGLLGNN